MNETLLSALLIVIVAAVLIQMIALVLLAVAVRKSAGRIDALSAEVQQRLLPTLDATQAMITQSGPKIVTILDNLNAATNSVRNEVEKVRSTVDDAVERARLHVARADEFVGRTMDRVEQTSDTVHHTVSAPVRHIAGVVQGISAGIGSFILGIRRGRHDGAGAPHDEMFI